MRMNRKQKKFMKLNPQASFKEFKLTRKLLKIAGITYSWLGLSILCMKGILPIEFRGENLHLDQINENVDILSSYEDDMRDMIDSIIGENVFERQLINGKRNLKIGIQQKLYDFYGDNVEKAVNEYNLLFEELGVDFHLSCEKMDIPLGYDIVVADDIFGNAEKHFVMVNMSLNNAIKAESYFNTIVVETDVVNSEEYFKQDNYLTGAFMHELGHALFNIQDNEETFNLWGMDQETITYNKFSHYDICAIASKTMDLSDPVQLERLNKCLERRVSEFKEEHPDSYYVRKGLKDFELEG